MQKPSLGWGVVYVICAISTVFDAINLWTQDIYPSDFRLSLQFIVAVLFFINGAVRYFTGQPF